MKTDHDTSIAVAESMDVDSTPTAAAATSNTRRSMPELDEATPKHGRVDNFTSLSLSEFINGRRVTKDHLQSIGQFLSLAGFLRASQVCRGWNAAATKIPSRRNLFNVRSAKSADLTLSELLNSNTGRHITLLRIDTNLDEACLEQLRTKMPQLNALECHLPSFIGARFGDTEVFSSSLTRLNLSIGVDDSAHQDANGDELEDIRRQWLEIKQCVTAVGRIRSLTTLNLNLHSSTGGGLRFPQHDPGAMTPLSQLADTLTSLTIEINQRDREVGLSHELFQTLRSLTKLTYLSVRKPQWTAKHFAALLDGPTPFPPSLQQINLNFVTVDTACGASLARLTSLTEFLPRDISDVSCVASFAQLTKVRLACYAEVDPAQLIAALSNCPLLHTLELSHYSMSSSQLQLILNSLPHIQDFTLSWMKSLRSLDFVSNVPHLRRTLRSLSLQYCRAVPINDVSHLRSLFSLENLKLASSFDAELDESTVSSMTPSSSSFLRECWPKLPSFIYSSPPPPPPPFPPPPPPRSYDENGESDGESP